jgi:hypothetical protein
MLHVTAKTAAEASSCTTAACSLLGPQGEDSVPENIEWFIEDKAFSLAYGFWLLPQLPPSLSRQKARPATTQED